MKTTLAACAALAVLGTTAARADQIAFFGTGVKDPALGEVALFSPAGIAAGTATGWFSDFSAGCPSCVTMTPTINYASWGGDQKIYQADLGGHELGLTATSAPVATVAPNDLTLNGEGQAWLDGVIKDVNWQLQMPGPAGTIHLTLALNTQVADAVPEPAALGLLLVGLIGLAAVSYRRPSFAGTVG